jgi:hypothetical protein
VVNKKGGKNKRWSKKIQCYYQNVRGLRSKTVLFRNNFNMGNFDIVALTETFLTTSVCDGELFPSGYAVFRRDRVGNTGWGGVLLAVRECYSTQVVTDIDGFMPDMELLCLIINCKNVKLLCCVVYLPPSYKDYQYLSVLTCMENLICSYSNLNVLIMGDFNLNSCSNNVIMQFENFCELCLLNENNHVINSHGGMLDLVLSDLVPDQVAVSKNIDPLVPVDKYHPALNVTIRLESGIESLAWNAAPPSHPPRPGTCPEWNWRRAEFHTLYTTLASIDWSDVFDISDINTAIELFYQKLYNCINLHVPLKKSASPSSENRYTYPKWYTNDIITALKSKYFHLKKYKLEGKEFNIELYKYYRWHAKKLIGNAYRQHIQVVQNSIFDEPVKFWEYVKDKRKDRRHVNSYTYGDRVLVGQEAADAFAQYFRSVFVDEVPRLDPSEAAREDDAVMSTSPISLTTISEVDVERAAKRLKSRSSGGPDGIPVFLAKDCLSVLKAPLIYLYNLSLKQATYPERWKLSRVTPIPKGEPGPDVTAYRPIAVLSVFAKLYEAVLNSNISRQLGSQLHNSQHGFRRARSTTTNLAVLVDYVASEMDAGRQVDAAYFDFKKAFDLVDNDRLLQKLSAIGFTPGLLRFFASYLRDRCQYVRLRGYESDSYCTRSGVSQGSTLGPTLFLVMVNDLPETVRCAESLLFADDLKLYMGVDSKADADALQSDIDAVAMWSVRNRLPFNTTKCKIMTFSRKRCAMRFDYKLFDTSLEIVDDIRDLGIILDSKIDFHKHVTNVCKSASRLLGFIMRTSSEFSSFSVVKVLYDAYVRSKLEYAAIVWDPHEKKYSLMIEKIQRKFARWLYKKYNGYYPFLYPSSFVYGMVGLDSLILRRKFLLIVHYLSIIHNRICRVDVVGRLSLAVPARTQHDAVGLVAPRRRPRLLRRPITRTAYAAHAPTARAFFLIGDMLAQNDTIDLFADGLLRLIPAAYRFLDQFVDCTFN